jgi:protein gp37
MAEKTGISWTDHTFNVAWGCVKVSPGCKHCYADELAARYGFEVWGPTATRRTFGEKHWNEPRKWARDAAREGRRHRVFCSSMCDVGEDHPVIAAEVVKLWPLIRDTPELDWQILSKRPERYLAILPRDWGAGYANVWLGTSVESMEYAWRIDALRACPAVTRFVSYEPALASIAGADLSAIDWLIYGGESGPQARADCPQWAAEAEALCRTFGTRFYFKQTSGPWPGMNRYQQIVLREFPGQGSETATEPRRPERVKP